MQASKTQLTFYWMFVDDLWQTWEPIRVLRWGDAIIGAVYCITNMDCDKSDDEPPLKRMC